MKAKKILAFLFASAVMMSFAGCGGKEKITENSVSDTNTAVTNTTESTTSTTQVNTEQSENNTSQPIEDVYSNKVYHVGEDLPPDTYVINCTISEYGMDVIVFESEKEYTDFQNANKTTNGKYRAAIEMYAWTDFYLNEDSNAFVNLKEGNIILLDNGKCEFTKHDTSSSNILHSGIYVAGEDINSAKIDIKCTSDWLQITIFENKYKYLSYHKTDRFTGGKEADAIEKNALSTDYIYTDNIASIDLEDGMILMIEDGTGEYSIDEGPIID